MIRILFIFIVLTLVTFSCNDSSKEKYKQYSSITFNIGELKTIPSKKAYAFSAFYKDNLDGFQLDTTGGIIGRVSKVKVVDKKIYLLDVKYAKKINVYDLTQGKYLFTIGKLGKGPGEYIMISDFEVDEKKGQILITDVAQKKILFFDLKGKFLLDKKLLFAPRFIAIKDDFLYFSILPDRKNKDCIVITDRDIHIIATYFCSNDYPVKGVSWGASPFFNYNDNLLLNFPYCDTIFALKGGKMSPHFAFNTGKCSFYAKVKNGDIKPNESFIVGKEQRIKYFNNCFVAFDSYFENDKYMSVCFNKNEKHFIFVYNKLNKDYMNVELIMKNDLFHISGVPCFFDSKIGSVFCSTADHLSQIQIDNTKIKCSDRFLQTLQHVNYNGNPLLVFMK